MNRSKRSPQSHREPTYFSRAILLNLGHTPGSVVLRMVYRIVAAKAVESVVNGEARRIDFCSDCKIRVHIVVVICGYRTIKTIPIPVICRDANASHTAAPRSAWKA